MRRKEYAVSLGLATPGKGRMSREALEAIEKARAGGQVFDDDVVTTPTPRAQPTVSVKKDISPRVASEDQPGDLNHVSGLYMRYPLETVFQGVGEGGKKYTVTARAICYNTSVSIVGCPCDSHRTLVSSLEVLTVTPKK